MAAVGTQDHEVVHVRFYDQATGGRFAESRVPAGQLPQSFEARTTLHLNDVDWEVVEARPATSAEFRRSGKLTLILRRVVTAAVDPGELLFSLPTIANDALPPVVPGSSKLDVHTIEIHEDDWRQVEWVSASAGDAIAAELEAVRRIYDQERQGVGFKKLHLRRAIPVPLAGRSFSLADLRSALGPAATWLAGFAYLGVAGVVDSSFAVRLISSIEIFGLAPGGAVQAVCFANTRTNNVPRPDVENLAGFAAAHDLVLVDWCAAAAVSPTGEEYAGYFLRAEN
jgi:hypothetical protein